MRETPRVKRGKGKGAKKIFARPGPPSACGLLTPKKFTRRTMARRSLALPPAATYSPGRIRPKAPNVSLAFCLVARRNTRHVADDLVVGQARGHGPVRQPLLPEPRGHAALGGLCRHRRSQPRAARMAWLATPYVQEPADHRAAQGEAMGERAFADLSGTPQAYRPDGSLWESGRRPPATGDYEAWKPG